MQSLGAPRSQEAPGQALTGRGVPCLYKAMRSASLLEINKWEEGYGCDKLERTENEFGSWWLADWGL